MPETLAALLAWFQHLNGTESALLGAGGTLLVLAAVARARKPTLPQLSEAPGLARGLCAWIAERWHGLLAALDYLRTRREWRYAQPWMLMLGEQGAGKSSLLNSVAASMRQTPPARAAELAADHTGWMFLREGVLIDADGRYAAAAPDSPEGAEWQKTLDQLSALRPERPLDGVVFCIAAPTLLGGHAQREALALRLNAQLAELQDAIEFALPLTVVVTQCDAIPGFAAYWNNQDKKRRKELFGYAAASQTQSTAPTEWTGAAFDALDDRLRTLQVETAASRDQLADGDAFFLFPGHFRNLRAPLCLFMETLLRSSAWQAGYLLRGLFFTGSPAAAGAHEVGPRKDVAFADSLLGMRVLAEPGLARATRHSLFSRNTLIRNLQYTSICLLLALFVMLFLSSQRATRQAEVLISAVQQLDRSTPVAVRHGDCLSAESVYPLLESIAAIDNNTRYWAIPASWVDTRIAGRNDHSIEQGAINAVLMPTLACRLENKARTLAASITVLPDDSADDAYSQLRDALNNELTAVRELEDNLDRFEMLAQKGGDMGRGNLLDTLSTLTQYAFDAPLPPAVMREHGALSAAFGDVPAGVRPALPARLREDLAQEITRVAHATRRGLNIEVNRGAVLLGKLDRGTPPVLNNTRNFAAWLEWAQKSWLLSTADANPCAELHDAAKSQIDVLVSRYAYPKSLWREVEQFNPDRCYEPELQNLVNLRQTPYGALFVPRKPNGYEMTTGLRRELDGLPALVALNFMRLEKPKPFRCQASSEGFRQAEIAEAAGYVSEYESFAKQMKVPLKLTDVSQRPLFERLARQSLASALDDAMLRAQIAPSTAPVAQVSMETVTRADQQLAAMSKRLSGNVDALVGVLRNYDEYGNAASTPLVRQCARDFAADTLGRVSALAASSRLYYPPPAPQGEQIFDLGSLPVQKEYLARQVARAQVLAGYATPFMTLLQDSAGVSDTDRSPSATAAFWHNTIDELNRYTQGKEPTGQVANLDDYFIKNLGDLTYAACAQQLAKYQSPELGDDLFSARRRLLEPMVQLRCLDRRVAQAMETYTDLAQRFNNELAGRYPFADAGAADANVGSTRQFFIDYDKQRATLGDALGVLNGEGARQARSFVAQLDAAANFFRNTLPAGNGDSTSAVNPVHLQLSFNAQAQTGSGSEQIVAWNIAIANRSAGLPNRGNNIAWLIGEAINLDLTWADRSLWTPQADSNQTDLNIVGNTASFTANGSWALLRLIDSHNVKHNPTQLQMLLGFGVPQQRIGSNGKAERGSASLFLGANLSVIDPKSKIETRLVIPTFPRAAPEIN